MKQVYIVKFKTSILAVFCVVTTTHAMPGAKHGQDIKESFGAKTISPIKLGQIISEVADKPIYLDKLPRILNLTNSTGRIISFQGAHGIHRVVFHWGWDTSPRDHEKLQIFLKKQDLSSTQIKTINMYLKSKWTKRKRTAQTKFRRLYKKRPAAKLAAIAYDIHILGDIGGSGDSYMISRTKLLDDLCRHVSKLKGSYGLIADLKHSNTKNALKTLKDQLPEIVNKNFHTK